MAQQQRPESVDTELHIETPVIDIQDLEHNPSPQTRVSNKGVKVEPRIDTEDMRDLAKEDEDALVALEEFEKQLKIRLPS